MQGGGGQCQYWGETARSGYLRGAEHRGDLEAHRETGHMVKHLKERHPTIDLSNPDNRIAEKYFTMKLHKKFRSAMDRQLGEALSISRAGGMESEGVMNSKDEYSRCIVPEIEISSGWKKWTPPRTDEKRTRETDTEGEERQTKKRKTIRQTKDRAQNNAQEQTVGTENPNKNMESTNNPAPIQQREEEEIGNKHRQTDNDGICERRMEDEVEGKENKKKEDDRGKKKKDTHTDSPRISERRMEDEVERQESKMKEDDCGKKKRKRNKEDIHIQTEVSIMTEVIRPTKQIQPDPLKQLKITQTDKFKRKKKTDRKLSSTQSSANIKKYFSPILKEFKDGLGEREQYSIANSNPISVSMNLSSTQTQTVNPDRQTKLINSQDNRQSS